MKKVNKKLIAPAIIAVAVYLLSYQIPKRLVDPANIHFLYMDIDDKIPFFAPAIYIYIAAFFQWAYCIHIVTKQKTQIGYKCFNALIVGSLIGFVVFLVYPTGVYRPQIVSSGFANDFCRFIYSVDNIICACPSFHCFCSTIVILIYKQCEDVSNKFIYLNIIFSILVIISTLLTKQHFVADIIPGIMLAYISVFIVEKITKIKKSV